MNPPDNEAIFEEERATFLDDDNGIPCTRAKRAKRTLHRQQKNYAVIRKITSGKRVGMLSGTNRASPQGKVPREYAAAEVPDAFKAIAIISDTVLYKFIANVFIGLKQQPIPVKMFHSKRRRKHG